MIFDGMKRRAVWNSQGHNSSDTLSVEEGKQVSRKNPKPLAVRNTCINSAQTLSKEGFTLSTRPQDYLCTDAITAEELP